MGVLGESREGLVKYGKCSKETKQLPLLADVIDEVVIKDNQVVGCNNYFVYFHKGTAQHNNLKSSKFQTC